MGNQQTKYLLSPATTNKRYMIFDYLKDKWFILISGYTRCIVTNTPNELNYIILQYAYIINSDHYIQYKDITLYLSPFKFNIEPIKQDFQKLKNQDIAEQLTLIIFNSFKHLRHIEFNDLAWTKPNREILAPNLCQYIDSFDYTMKWVQMTILKCKSAKKRGRMIKKFIKILDILLTLNNFQSFSAVYASLTSSLIDKLDGWKYVPQKHMNRFNAIKCYFYTAHNMENLRKLHRRNSNAAMIPYSGIFLCDIRKETDKNKINKTIQQILTFTKSSYDHIMDNYIVQSFIYSQFASQCEFKDNMNHVSLTLALTKSI